MDKMLLKKSASHCHLLNWKWLRMLTEVFAPDSSGPVHQLCKHNPDQCILHKLFQCRAHRLLFHQSVFSTLFFGTCCCLCCWCWCCCLCWTGQTFLTENSLQTQPGWCWENLDLNKFQAKDHLHCPVVKIYLDYLTNIVKCLQQIFLFAIYFTKSVKEKEGLKFLNFFCPANGKHQLFLN